MTVEFWRWKEYNWHDPEMDPRDAEVLSAGVDVGSVSSQAVVMADGKLFAFSNMRTGSDSPESANKAMSWALEDTDLGLDDIDFTVGTGYGRVNVPFAGKAITEIACHARGANFLYGPSVRTVLDMGGQDCKAIHCDEKGKVTAFLMNDKCAAGTGRFFEVMARALEVDLDDLGGLAADATKNLSISSMCTVFAESEVVSLVARGEKVEDIVAGLCRAVAERTRALAQRVGIASEVTMTGGVAKNLGVVRALEELIGHKFNLPQEPQIVGALGAALYARDAALLEATPGTASG
jgi:bzd-type benzoyl-CoA reductase Q subunit